MSLYLLLVGTPAVLLAILTRRPEFLFPIARFAIRVAFALVGIRCRVIGRENIPPGGVVFCANHQSNVDPPVVFLAVPSNVRMLYKIEFDRIPILAQAMHATRFVAIDRRNREQAARAIERAASLVRSGVSFVVYPEGTRSPTGELLPFKKGGFIMAIQAQAPMVPVVMTGAFDAMKKGSKVINPVTVSVRIGKPIETRGMTIDDRDELVARMRSAIEGLLAQGPV